MALLDINFQSGEGQCFITEISAGTLEAAADILVEPSSSQYPVSELPEVAPAAEGDNVFIMLD